MTLDSVRSYSRHADSFRSKMCDGKYSTHQRVLSVCLQSRSNASFARNQYHEPAKKKSPGLVVTSGVNDRIGPHVRCDAKASSTEGISMHDSQSSRAHCCSTASSVLVTPFVWPRKMIVFGSSVFTASSIRTWVSVSASSVLSTTIHSVTLTPLNRSRTCSIVAVSLSIPTPMMIFVNRC